MAPKYDILASMTIAEGIYDSKRQNENVRSMSARSFSVGLWRLGRASASPGLTRLWNGCGMRFTGSVGSINKPVEEIRK